MCFQIGIKKKRRLKLPVTFKWINVIFSSIILRYKNINSRRLWIKVCRGLFQIDVGVLKYEVHVHASLPEGAAPERKNKT